VSSDAEIDVAGAELSAEEPRTALVVVADGSNSRTEKAPGYLDADAEPFDADVAKALAAGDPALLASVDRDRAVSVGAAGRPAWRAAAAALSGSSYGAELLCDEAPYGVGYLVAVWRR
jgi:aromatic ring-opening dioxygenase LigB subunit